jgi:hypothetical protein
MEVSGICCEPTYLIVKPEYKVVRTRLLDLRFPREEVLCSLEGVIHLDGAGVGISSGTRCIQGNTYRKKYIITSQR